MGWFDQIPKPLPPRRTGSLLKMNQLSSRNNQLGFKTLGDFTDRLKESIEYTSNE